MNYQRIQIKNNIINQHKQTDHERNSIGWGQRYAVVPYHQGNQQTAYPDFRQTDDLLSYFRIDAGRHKGDTDYLYTLRPAWIQAAVG